MRTLIQHFGQDDKRITHAMRVLFHAENILATSPECDSEIVIAAAILHDVGIKISEETLGYSNGETQEQLGPPEAEKLLNAISFPPEKTKIVKDIISNHHSPSRFDYVELEILKKADLIVNRDEKV